MHNTVGTCSYHAHSPGLVYTTNKEFNTSSTGEIIEYKRLNGWQNINTIIECNLWKLDLM